MKDGEFELMKYKCSENITLPFKVIPRVVEVNASRFEYAITLKSTFDERFISIFIYLTQSLFATDVLVIIPTPLNTSNTSIISTLGKTKYVGSENCIQLK